MTDLFFFIFCAVVVLSFSFSVVDGIPYFVVVWLGSIFLGINTGLAVMPDFVRTIWCIFFLGMLAGRILYPLLFEPVFHLSNAKKKLIEHTSIEGTPSKPFFIKQNILTMFVFLFIVNLALFFTGFGKNTDYTGVINAGSKSLIPYVTEGVSKSLLTFWALSIITFNKAIIGRSYTKFLNLYLPLPQLSSIIDSLKYIAYILIYGTKLVVPVFTYMSFRFYVLLVWCDIRNYFRTLKINISLLILLAAFIVAAVISYSLLLSFDVSIFDLLFFKFINRSDLYSVLSPENLDRLTSAYQGNILYFFHPFLRLIGSQAYEMPMGTFLISMGSNLKDIGGPNTHLPVTLFVIANQGIIGYISIFMAALLCAFALLRSRNKILKRIACLDNRPIFWSFFTFSSFPLLVVEPSAFSHSLFFSCISYFIVFKIKPSLLQVVKAP